jgi:hypothetical protein
MAGSPAAVDPVGAMAEGATIRSRLDADRARLRGQQIALALKALRDARSSAEPGRRGPLDEAIASYEAELRRLRGTAGVGASR